jgi:hypothetical protein
MARGIKTGGRQKGTSNKLTATIKEKIAQAVENEIEKLPLFLRYMDAKDSIDIMIKLLPYIVPKIAPVDASNETTQENE